MKQLYLISYPIFIATSAIFSSAIPLVDRCHHYKLVAAGICVAAWGFYLKSSTSSERIKAIADMLILSNVLMLTQTP